MDPCVTFQGSLALLLVAFALEKVQKSAEESEDQIDQILAVLPPRSEDQVDQVFGVRTGPSRRVIRS